MGAQTLRYRVEGMDCASCAATIENALARIDGVSDVQVNYAAERLTFRLAETGADVIEAKIRSLGYVPSSADAKADPARHQHRDKTLDMPWWRKTKGHRVIAIGGMFAAAWVASHVLPNSANLFYVIAAVGSVVPFAKRAAILAVSGTPFSIELLMVVAAVGAVLIGEPEEAAVVVFLFAIGELLENVAAGRARAGIKALISLVPRTAFLRKNGVDREVPADQLAVGDVILVRPGDRVASDGEVIEGASDVDETPITGESVPVTKWPGSIVRAGSINANGALLVKVTHEASDNTIARIVHMVEEAQASKAPLARFIERFSACYTPAAMVVSALVILVPPLAFDGDWSTWIYRGLALLLITCPCALVISTPAAIASGLSAGARRGLLVKGGAPLEVLGHLKTIAFDKTGTLTLGSPCVTDIVSVARAEQEVLARAAAVEKGSSHPLAKAIVAAAADRSLELPSAFGSMAVPGKAVTARLKDGFVTVGSPRDAALRIEVADDVQWQIRRLEEQGKTVVVVASGKTLDGLIAMRDEPRENSRAAIQWLRDLDIRPIMLTGDNTVTGTAIAADLGIDVEAELLPDQKLARIEGMKDAGPIAMVGDGINDAPALAAASVGIAMGGGTDVALETADAALLNSRVSGVAELVELSRSTLSNIRQNIALALALKAIFLVTTLTGTTSLWMAILADTGATVLVTANAMRLLRWRGSR